jgi:hypothetical protein
MNAADVLAHSLVPKMSDLATAKVLAALLAHGEQGVAILPDGTLWALEYPPADLALMAERLGAMVGYRLVPRSAEAGDTDA